MRRIILLLLVLGAFTQGVTQGQGELPIASQVNDMLRAGKADDAIKAVSAALSVTPEDMALKVLLGQAYYQKTDYAKTIETLTPVARPTTPEANHYRSVVQMLAMSHYLLGHLADSIPYLEQLTIWTME